MAKWTTKDIPDQSGRVVVITGANTGLGYETAAALAEHGAHVVLAVRNLDKGKDAVARITATGPRGEVALQELDLTSLESVRASAEQLRADHDHIDLLINNAGVMWTPKSTTKDGFELQFGTNHLGHFAFTGLLLDRLLPVAGSRVVTVSNGSAATTGWRPTGSPSCPTCCSPMSCSGGWRHTGRRSPLPRTRVAQRRSWSVTYPAGPRRSTRCSNP